MCFPHKLDNKKPQAAGGHFNNSSKKVEDDFTLMIT